MSLVSVIRKVRINPSADIDSVGQMVTLDGVPIRVCKTEIAAKLLRALLRTAQKATDTKELVKIATIVIKVESTKDNQFSILSTGQKRATNV